MARIVVIEDNPDLREEVLFHLRRGGHEATGYGDAAALDAAGGGFDIAVIDIGLPGEDGLSLAARLRRTGDAGIVMLTARGTLDDRVRGLDTGADSYLVKPVDMRELLAVVGSLARRVGGGGPAWRLDLRRRALFAPDGREVPLTDTEFRLVDAMALAAPDVASRRAMAEALGEEDYLAFDERRLEAAISRLRRKLQAAVGESPLRAARGRGYLFAAAVTRD